MSDLIDRLNKAEGSPTLKTVMIGMFNAEKTCLDASKALAQQAARIEELEAALSDIALTAHQRGDTEFSSYVFHRATEALKPQEPDT